MMPEENNADKAIFVDLDGCMIEDIPRNVDPDLPIVNTSLLRMIAGAQWGRVSRCGYRDKVPNYKVIIITNKGACVATGSHTIEELGPYFDRLVERFRIEDVWIDGIHYCPHYPRGYKDDVVPEFEIDCECRKPKPGMILQAAKDHDIDLSKSIMIGDSDKDIEAGKAAGCGTILVDFPRSVLKSA
jgi:histidinol-phosphate phosphatase family protein